MPPGILDIGGWIVRVVDVLVVAGISYSLAMLARGTRAWKIISGLLVFGAIYLLSDVLRLRTLNWVLGQIVPLAPVALVILFYPELRYALEEVGRVQFWQNRLHLLPPEKVESLVGELVQVATTLASRHVGALIVIEREESLEEYVGNGVPLNGIVTRELLNTLFHPGSALHDGAVVLRGDRVLAAGCVLPLTERTDVGTEVHTRHRAAMGISERTDALVIVVSEESGSISLSIAGDLERGLRGEALTERLLALLRPPAPRRARPQGAPGLVAGAQKKKRAARR